MEYKDKIASTNDIEWLKQELLDSHERNNALHRRLQKVEGVDQRFETMKSNMERCLNETNETWRGRTNRWKKKAQKLCQQMQSLPFFIKWIYKL